MKDDQDNRPWEIKDKERLRLWHIALPIAVVIFLICFGLLYAMKDASFTVDLTKGSVLSEAVNLSLASKFDGYENYRPLEKLEPDVTCAIDDNILWFEFSSPAECALTRSTPQASQYCGWFDIGITCVGIVVPSLYFQSEPFKNRLFRAVRSPCDHLLNTANGHYGRLKNRLSCSKGRDFRKYDVVIMVIEEKWESFSSFREMDRSANTEEIYYMDRHTGEISKINSLFWLFL